MLNWAGLVARIKAGEASAGAELVSLLGPQLDLYCETLAPNVSTLEREAAVEAALRNVVRKIDKYDSERASLPTWARAFVRNALRDVLRESLEIATDSARLNDFLDATATRDSYATDAQEAPTSSTDVALVSILLQLPDAHILYAHAVEGLTFPAIAERMSQDGPITAATVRKRYQRVRLKIIEAARRDPDLRALIKEDPQ